MIDIMVCFFNGCFSMVSMVFLWCFYGVSMVFLWCICVLTLLFLGDTGSNSANKDLPNGPGSSSFENCTSQLATTNREPCVLLA